jgi:hypothetical protein
MKTMDSKSLAAPIAVACALLQGCGDLPLDNDLQEASDAAAASEDVDTQTEALAGDPLVITWQDIWDSGVYTRISGGSFRVSEDRDIWIGFRCISPPGASTWAAVALLGGPTYKNTSAYHCDGKWYREKVRAKAGNYYLFWLSDGGGRSVSLAAWRRP